jgi:competence protein ComEC
VTWPAAAIAAALAGLRDRRRHLVLGAAVAGMLAAPWPAVAVASLPLAAWLAGAPLAGVPARPRLALLAAAALLGGALFAHARLSALDRTALRPLIGREVSMRGHLLERPRAVGAGEAHAALIRLTAGRGAGERVVVRATQWPRLDVGEEVAARGPLLALRERDAWLRRRGAHGRLLARAIRSTGRRRGGVSGALDSMRRAAERSVSSGLDPPRAALARGMVLGEDEALDDNTREDFRISGLAHLLAASGQNVMLLIALGLPVLTLLGLGLRGRLIGCLVLVALYVPLAGGGPSIQRAGVMGGAGIVAVLASRPASRWYALLLAAAVTLGLDPRAAADPGWQLSFGAVVAIVLLASPLALRLRGRRVPPAAAEAAAVAAAATLGTAPLLALHFERLSIVSLPANLLAAPAVAPVMWLGMLAAAAGAVIPASATLLNALAEFPLAYLGGLAHSAASLPAASVSVHLGSPAALAAAYGGLAAIVVALARGGRLRRTALAALAIGGAWLAASASAGRRVAEPPDPRDVVVSFLDVGQGDATLIQHGGAAVLVDTGPPGSRLPEHLRAAGVRRIDLLVVTHGQVDHEGGAAGVLDRMPVGLVLDGADGTATPLHRVTLAAAAHHGVRRISPDAGQALRIGPLELDVLWPRREVAADHAGEDPNQRAIVARLRAGAFDLLLPADAESDVTASLDLPAVEALKVAHHGSADTGTPDLLHHLEPRIAVVEVGRDNSYGHPAPGTLAALKAVPAVYRTDRDGTVRLTVRDGHMTVTTGR